MTEREIEEGIGKILFTTLFAILLVIVFANVGVVFITLLKTLFAIL